MIYGLSRFYFRRYSSIFAESIKGISAGQIMTQNQLVQQAMDKINNNRVGQTTNFGRFIRYNRAAISRWRSEKARAPWPWKIIMRLIVNGHADLIKQAIDDEIKDKNKPA